MMQNQHFSLIFIWEGLVIAVFTILEIVFNFRVFSLVSKAHEQNMMVRVVKGGLDHVSQKIKWSFHNSQKTKS